MVALRRLYGYRMWSKVVTMFCALATLVACGSAEKSDASRNDLQSKRWQLVSLSFNGKQVAIPTSVGADVSFDGNGRLSASDGLNAYTGTYSLNDTVVYVAKVGSTAIGSTNSGVQAAAARGTVAVFIGSDSDVRKAIRWRLVKKHLRLIRAGYTLTYQAAT